MLDEIERLKKRVYKAFALRQECLKTLAQCTGKKRELYHKKFQILNEKYWILQEKLDYLSM